MKAVILAGGFGTRISEESRFRPKPMLEIGGKPILWHIMKTYSCYGIRDFIICAGYKQQVIKEYFANYALYNSDMSFEVSKGTSTVHTNSSEDWTVTVADTGLETMTGGRIKRIARYLDDEPFCLTYGDGLTDARIDESIAFHKKEGKLATIMAVKPEPRFGTLDLDGSNIRAFREKSKEDVGWINGGYMVLEPSVVDYIEGDPTVFEQAPLMGLARDGQLNAYFHDGFWQCMDTLREKEKLCEMWDSGKAPWKVWRIGPLCPLRPGFPVRRRCSRPGPTRL
jgi:glucose-1-phosphate cytidylyltransferase